MVIRGATLKDSRKIYDLEKRVWGNTGASLKMIESRLKVFPEGAYVAEKNKNIVGVVFFELITSKNNFRTWYDYTDNGCIAKSHKPNGDTIFGIDLSVLEEYSGKGIGSDLLLRVADYSIEHNIKRGILGGRMPFYYKYADEVSPEAYLKLKDDGGKLVDPELRFYTRAGLSIKELIPNYFEDPHSKDYGVLLEWTNPFYKIKNQIAKKIAKYIFRAGFKLEILLAK